LTGIWNIIRSRFKNVVYSTVSLFKIRYMILSTTETIPGKEIETILGVARGSTVRARSVGRDFMAGLKNIVGGEIEEYTKLQAHSREQAMQRMIEDAKKMGADGIVNIRLNTSMIMQGAAEILAYGTAVKFKS
jgi:uncharacterized protein YbjQ (UPF0145 family)